MAWFSCKLIITLIQYPSSKCLEFFLQVLIDAPQSQSWAEPPEPEVAGQAKAQCPPSDHPGFPHHYSTPRNFMYSEINSN